MSNTPPTIYGQDGQLFVGRQQEQENFRQLLQERLNLNPQIDYPAIVLLYGNGGMGKTSLAKRFQQIAIEETPFSGQFETIWLDWEDEKRKHRELRVGRENIKPKTVFDRLYNKLIHTNSEWELKLSAYQDQRTQQEEAEQAVSKALLRYEHSGESANYLSHVSVPLLAKVLQMTPNMGAEMSKAFWQVGVKVDASESQALQARLSTYLQAQLSPAQYEWFLNPHEQLARNLGHSLWAIAQPKPLLLFLDTYEIVDTVDIWVRELIKTAGAKVIWVIVGRQDLVKSRYIGNDYFQGYSYDFSRGLQHYDMLQLAEANVQAYLANRVPDRVPTAEEIRALTQVSRGIPLAMKTTAELWGKGVSLTDIVGDITAQTPHKEIVKRMTERYLIHAINNKQDERAIYALAWARGNITMLTAMLSEEPMELSPRLAELRRAYAAIHLDEARLHDEPTDFINSYLYRGELRTSPTLQQMLKRAIIALTNERQKREGVLPLLEEQANDERWVQLTLDLTRTLFWLDEQQGWQSFFPTFVAGLAYSQDLAKGLVAVVGACRPFLRQQGQKDVQILRDGIETWAFLPSDIDKKEPMVKLLMKIERQTANWLSGNEMRAILWWQQGELTTSQGKHEQAVRVYNRVYDLLSDKGTQLREQVGEGMNRLARKLMWPSKKRYAVSSPLAVELLEKSVACANQNEKAWYLLGVAYNEISQHEKAIEVFERAIELDSKDAWSYHGLGIAYRQLGQYKDSMELYEKAIALDPQNANFYHNLGHLYEDLERYDEAVEAYEKSAILDAKIGYECPGLGNVYQKLGENEKSIDAYKEAIKNDPENAGVWHALGHLYEDLERYDEAVEAYEKSAQLDAEIGYECLGLARVYEQLGRYEKVIEVYKKAIESHQNNSSIYNDLGLIYERQGRHEEAVKVYKTSITLDPYFVYAYMSLAGCYRRLGWQAEYKDVLEKARPFIYKFKRVYERACCASIMGETDKALILLKQAIAKSELWRKQAKTEMAFDFIRHDPRFVELVGGGSNP